MSITAAIIGTGGFTKAGAGALQFSGANTFVGATTVSGGLLTLSGAAAKCGSGNVIVQPSVSGSELQIQSGVQNAIADTATLSLSNGVVVTSGLGALVAGGATVDLGTGINEKVQSLLLNGVTQGPGTYGSSSSSAMFKNDAFFSGTGVVTVTVPEPASVSLWLMAMMGFIGATGKSLSDRGGARLWKKSPEVLFVVDGWQCFQAGAFAVLF